MWLPLARRSAPTQDNADKSPNAPPATRAAPMPCSWPGTCSPAPPPYDAEVRRHARALLKVAEALPAVEWPAQVEQLRRALVEAGEVDLARTTKAG
ncbi:hypothetical protein [Streptomyces viridosporus]|uniref:hypothetical protein n=1 Tax=Streptomyces viridosporus TaxID=67581 RepID=UPI0036FE8BD9